MAVFLLSSCNITKHIPEHEVLLHKNTVEINGNNKPKENLNPYIVQKPNSDLLPPVSMLLHTRMKLALYNMGNPLYQEKWQKRILKHRDSGTTFSKVFSYKQAVGYANFQKKLSEWVFKNGEAPVLLDTSKTLKTLKNLKQYHIDKGFFKAQAHFSTQKIGAKKVGVKYQITTGKPYFLDSIKPQIASPVLDSLYQRTTDKSLIKAGQQYNRLNFEKEADRLTSLFRNSGVYQFSKYSINFREIDSTRSDYKTPVILDIPNRLIEVGDSIIEVPYKISHIERVNIFTDYSYLKNDKKAMDSIYYNGYYLYGTNGIPYNPKHFVKHFFIRQGDRFSDESLEKTRTHLRSINNFKSIRFGFEEIDDDKLVSNIYLTPVKKLGIKLEGEGIHSNIKPLGITGIFSINSINTFRGNDILKIGLQGSLINSAKFEGNFFNAWEIGADISLKVPRMITPFKTEKLIPQSMSPTTSMSLGASLQKNIGLDKQRFTGILAYNWKGNSKSSHAVELLNLQLIKNLNIESFFDIYTSEYKKLLDIQTTFFPTENLNNPLSFIETALTDEIFQSTQPDAYKIIQNVKNRYQIITEDALVPALTYTFTHNTQRSYQDQNYFYFRSRFTSSGLLSSSLSNKQSELGDKQIAGVNIAQYVKLDLDYKKHWELPYNGVLAFRTGIGIAMPYGNSSSIPFSRSYFAGGPNDNRAWKIYELGPGAQQSGLEFNVGNLKFISSIEYRFDIINSFKGALFIDAGNIWDITRSDLTSDEAKFTDFNSLKNIAIGSGFGIRYDFSFLVLRGDVGFKTYEPYLVNENKWFSNYNRKNAVLNIGINYPF
jgi:outer membrane protein assembly factor BamA